MHPLGLLLSTTFRTVLAAHRALDTFGTRTENGEPILLDARRHVVTHIQHDLRLLVLGYGYLVPRRFGLGV